MNPIQLPHPVTELLPHRPPILLVATLLERNQEAVVEATVPATGIWLDPNSRVLPEYYIELVAQAMAAVNGYDARQAGKEPEGGMLVGVDHFSLLALPDPGRTVWIDVAKTFEFGAVKIVNGVVRDADGKLAEVKLKIWSGDLPGGTP
ncbi:ACP dehydratase [Desulfurivibrio sp. D14AmB]|uniref:ACP dehydratase n=1 Tax=Desulfurivibrio sp. D14AmB TaxID=3374370 RepID=UPI00376F1399